jgi:quinol monooxygenase YgiN
VFISIQRIKHGKHERNASGYREAAEAVQASKPGTVAYLAYMNEDGSDATVIHVFADAETMKSHMQGVGKMARKASEYIEIVSFEVYGKPNDETLQMMQRAAGNQTPLSFKPVPVGGSFASRPGERRPPEPTGRKAFASALVRCETIDAIRCPKR